MNAKWTAQEIPDLQGKVAIVTGANSGIGFETARALAAHGARTILACRNPRKGAAALAEIKMALPQADAVLMSLDLASLAVVRTFAAAFKADYGRLDILVNNAGIMMMPFARTEDGFESQFGTNHLGHFALTGLLWDLILATPGARIVNVSSFAHRMVTGQPDLEKVNAEAGYSTNRAYGMSKLANLLFTLELNRRLQAAGADALAAAAHPGWTVTSLQRGFVLAMSYLVGQGPAMGALPSLYAAVGPDVQPNDYFGPRRLMEMRGHPKRARRTRLSQDAALAARLWQVSQKLTGVVYGGAAVAAETDSRRRGGVSLAGTA